ncbi:type II secretion system protein [Clostridium sp. DJ247]|uniref:type II secretion system protein n=1 Tax=Clostridium sp. DJ247 TaxID=2726188 RepID=UPI001F4C9396|nr:type II secretion system protein [Clostridium sp. DJ247]
MNKHKGFTFIELIIVLSILCTIFSMSLVNIGGYSKLQNSIDVDVFSNDVVNFINNSKSYCRDNNIGGYIYFDTNKNSVSFICGLKKIYTLNLPDKFTLNIVRPGNKIKIDNRGITSDACTIRYKDRKGKPHYITMSVGTAYVEIKN